MWIAGITRRFRLWRARTFGPPVGEWGLYETRAVFGGELRLCWSRLRPDGTYEYRLLTEDEERRYQEEMAW